MHIEMGARMEAIYVHRRNMRFRVTRLLRNFLSCRIARNLT